MLNLGDRVKHLDTNDIGIVISYGKRIVNHKCLTTVKVKLTDSNSNKKTTMKDLDSKWFPCPEDYRLSHPNPLSRHLIIKPVKRYELARSA